jgi:hypothetical protein
MYRDRRSSPRREALGEFLGLGRKTFYARFKRYKIPFCDLGKAGCWVLLATVTDEDCLLLTDHLWAVLPNSLRHCSWALAPRSTLRIEAEVGQYETRRYDYSLCKSVDVTDYCFGKVFDYEPIKHFPVITPRFEREAALFLDKLLKRPELVKRWSGYPSLTGLPKEFFPSDFLL